jgi:hypothetical protein
MRAKKNKQPKTQTRGPLGFHRGEAEQPCNLCCQSGELSWAYVPPRGCGDEPPINIVALFGKAFTVDRPKARSNEGLRYRTLCAPCAGEISTSDRAVADLSRQLRSLVWGMSTIQDEVTVKMRPAAILRSIFAHILAARLHAAETDLDASIRLYLRGNELDHAIRVYCWPYPFYEAAVARNFSFVDHVNGYALAGTASVLKFFPLAFLVTNATTPMPFDRLDSYAKLSDSDEVTYSINMRMVMESDWPERPSRMRGVRGDPTLYEGASTFGGRFRVPVVNPTDQPPTPNVTAIASLKGDQTDAMAARTDSGAGSD